MCTAPHAETVRQIEPCWNLKHGSRRSTRLRTPCLKGTKRCARREYSDGSPLRAADIRASLERTIILLPEEVGALLFDSVVGVNRCLKAGPRCNLSAGIVTNEQAGTVTINLRRPDPQLLEKLQSLFVTPADTPRTPLRTHPPPGTGPYRIEQIVPNRRALLTRNPYFEPAERERPAGFADRVEVEMGDERDQAEDVERGRLDVATVYAPATGATAALRTRLGARLRSGPFAMTEYAWLNTSAPPFDDQRVRQALNLAVDRGRIVDLTGGTESADPTCQLLPPGLPGYRPVCSFTLAPSPAGAWKGADPARAQALIAQSGARGTPIEVWAFPERASVGRYLAQVLTGLGFPAHVRVFKGIGGKGLGESIEAVGRPGERPQIGLNGWIADSPDSATFLRALIGCDAEFNLASFCDPKIDTAVARAEAAGAEGSSAWQRIERQIAQRAPVVPLTTRRYVVVTSARAGNVQFHPIHGLLLDQIWVE